MLLFHYLKELKRLWMVQGHQVDFYFNMGLIFLAWLCIAAAYDAQWRKSLNWVAILGLIFATIALFMSPDARPVNVDLISAILGALGSFFIFYIFYHWGLMGAGDVKFAAVLGFWVGWKLFVPIWALSCGFAVLHGVIAKSHMRFFWVNFSHSMNFNSTEKRRFIPYVTYLSIATVVVLMISK